MGMYTCALTQMLSLRGRALKRVDCPIFFDASARVDTGKVDYETIFSFRYANVVCL